MSNFNTTTDGLLILSSFPPTVTLSTAQNVSTGMTNFVLPQYAKMIFYVLQCVLVVLGLVGNVLVVLSVRCSSRMKKSISNLFIMNLAIADICVLVIGHTFILGLEIREFDWPFGEFGCRALYPFSDSFYGVSIGSIVSISFHRYRGIVHTMCAQLTAKRARVMVCATWLSSVILLTLPLWVFMELQQNAGTKTCLPIWPNRASSIAYSVTLSTCFYFLPLALILYFYYYIRLSLKQSSGFHRRMSTSISQSSALRNDVSKRIRGNTKALRVLTPVVVIFFVTMLPFTVFRLLLVFAVDEMSRFPYTRVIFFGCIIMILANSSANPIIYTIASPEFRRSFMRFLGMKCLAERGRFSKWQKKSSNNASCVYLSTQPNDNLKLTYVVVEDSL